jgi:hypothetical protein
MIQCKTKDLLVWQSKTATLTSAASGDVNGKFALYASYK